MHETLKQKLPTSAVAFIRRVMGLPTGVHVIVLVKSSGGGNGIDGWAVTNSRLEKPRSKKNWRPSSTGHRFCPHGRGQWAACFGPPTAPPEL